MSIAAMITHAAYHAANPLPRFAAPLRIEYAIEPPVIDQRTHRIADRDDSAPKIVGNSDYIAALSKTEWCDTAYLVAALGVSSQTVVDKMRRKELADATEKRVNGRGGKYEWRLK